MVSGGDGPAANAYLLEVVLIHAMVHREVILQVAVERVEVRQLRDNRRQLDVHLHQRSRAVGAHVRVNQRGQRRRVVRRLAVPVLEEAVKDGRMERRVVGPERGGCRTAGIGMLTTRLVGSSKGLLGWESQDDTDEVGVG